MTDADMIADAAIERLGRLGVQIFRSDIPGLFVGPTIAELTFNQLLSAVCYYDPAFEPHALCARTWDQMTNTVASVATSGVSVAPVATSRCGA